MQDADLRHRQLERIGCDLREHRLDALPDRGRPDIDRDTLPIDLDARVLARARSTALDEAGDPEAMVAPVDQLALKRALVLKAGFGEALIERGGIVAAVALRGSEAVVRHE